MRSLHYQAIPQQKAQTKWQTSLAALADSAQFFLRLRSVLEERNGASKSAQLKP
jgi:hypothetical protein